jgi:YafQ family addiction module toxin component
MKYTDFYSEELTRKLKKIKKKDKYLFDIIMDKIDEIIENPTRYKPLRYKMKDYRRVHIKKSFVLIFKVDEDNQTIKFEDFEHHDKIYRIR